MYLVHCYSDSASSRRLKQRKQHMRGWTVVTCQSYASWVWLSVTPPASTAWSALCHTGFSVGMQHPQRNNQRNSYLQGHIPVGTALLPLALSAALLLHAAPLLCPASPVQTAPALLALQTHARRALPLHRCHSGCCCCCYCCRHRCCCVLHMRHQRTTNKAGSACGTFVLQPAPAGDSTNTRLTHTVQHQRNLGANRHAVQTAEYTHAEDMLDHGVLQLLSHHPPCRNDDMACCSCCHTTHLAGTMARHAAAAAASSTLQKQWHGVLQLLSRHPPCRKKSSGANLLRCSLARSAAYASFDSANASAAVSAGDFRDCRQTSS
jgi:hypothetical protein